MRIFLTAQNATPPPLHHGINLPLLKQSEYRFLQIKISSACIQSKFESFNKIKFPKLGQNQVEYESYWGNAIQVLQSWIDPSPRISFPHPRKAESTWGWLNVQQNVCPLSEKLRRPLSLSHLSSSDHFRDFLLKLLNSNFLETRQSILGSDCK